jgi:hypothetical protein
MSAEAICYVAEQCSRLSGGHRALLYAIAYLIPTEGERMTPLLQQRTLMHYAGGTQRTIQRNVEELAAKEVGMLLVHRESRTLARYELAQMHVQGRLWSVRPPGVDDNLSSTGRRRPNDSLSSNPDNLSRGSHHLSAVRTNDLEEEREGTQDHRRRHSRTPLRVTPDGLAAVGTFLRWWVTNYPVYNSGVPAVLNADDDRRVLALLRGVPLVRLKLMAIVLWVTIPGEQPHPHRDWIASGDRGIAVLKHKARFLSDEVSRLRLESVTSVESVNVIEIKRHLCQLMKVPRGQVVSPQRALLCDPVPTLDASWQRIVNHLRGTVDLSHVVTLFEQCRLVTDSGIAVWIAAPTWAHRDQLRTFQHALEAAVSAVLGQRQIEFRVDDARGAVSQ